MPLTTYTAGEVLTAASLNANFSFAAGGNGLVCVKAETAFTTAATISADNVFTSDYTNYRLMIRTQAAGNIQTILQLRVGGVTATAGNYNVQTFLATSTTLVGSRSTSQTSFPLGTINGAFFTGLIIDIFAPALASPTSFAMQSAFADGAYTVPYLYHYVGNHSLSTAYDGFVFTPSSTTLTGTYTVYGYGKTV